MKVEEVARREVALEEFLHTWIKPTPERIRSYRVATEDVPLPVLLGALRTLVRSWNRGITPPPAAILERTSERLGSAAGDVPAHRRESVARKRLEQREIRNPSPTQIQLEIAQFPQVFGRFISEQAATELAESGVLPRLDFENLERWGYAGACLWDFQLGLRPVPIGPKPRSERARALLQRCSRKLASGLSIAQDLEETTLRLEFDNA